MILLGLLVRAWRFFTRFKGEDVAVPMALPRHLWPSLPPMPMDVRIEGRIPDDAEWSHL